MNEQEFGECDCCGKKTTLSRKYFNYSIKCDCCNGDEHFQIVRHCENCIPKPPENVKIILQIQPNIA